MELRTWVIEGEDSSRVIVKTHFDEGEENIFEGMEGLILNVVFPKKHRFIGTNLPDDLYEIPEDGKTRGFAAIDIYKPIDFWVDVTFSGDGLTNFKNAIISPIIKEYEKIENVCHYESDEFNFSM